MSLQPKYSPEELQIIGKRLRQIRKAKMLTQAELAALFDYKDGAQSLISGLETGRLPVGRLTVDLYVNNLGASARYITQGEGPMFSTPVKAGAPKVRGNLKVVRTHQLEEFHDSHGRRGFDLYVHPLLTGEHIAFEVGDTPPPRLPPHSLLITTLHLEETPPPVGSLLVARLHDGFVIGYLERHVQEYLRLNTAAGSVSIKRLKRPYLFVTHRVDQPYTPPAE